MFMPMRARQIWFRGPSACSKASGGQLLLVRAPAHLGRGRCPSSRKPSMLQVLTNSSTCLGRSVICVSRSLQWITFTPSFMRQAVERPRRRSAAGSPRRRPPSTLPSASSRSADVEQALLGEVRDQARVGAVLEHGRRARARSSSAIMPADVHVPPVERPLGGMLVGRRRRRGPRPRPRC